MNFDEKLREISDRCGCAYPVQDHICRDCARAFAKWVLEEAAKIADAHAHSGRSHEHADAAHAIEKKIRALVAAKLEKK